MSYVIYNTESTRYLKYHPGVKTNIEHFSTEAAAKAALTREIKNTANQALAMRINRNDFAIVESGVFYATIEKTVPVKNLMTGALVQQSVNTPRCCDVSSNLYWSM